MARGPIDTGGTPFVSAPCSTGCGAHVVAVPGQEPRAMCIECGRAAANITHAWFVPVPYDDQHTPHTYSPPPAVYPPSTANPLPMTVFDPNVIAVCLSSDHTRPDDRRVTPATANPDDVVQAFYGHDLRYHRRNAWLVGGVGGAKGDICNPCGGGNPDGTAMADGPRHDLCLKGKTRRRGGDCGCTHDKPHMRGIKPPHLVTARPTTTPTTPAPPPAPLPDVARPTLFTTED